MNVKSFEGRAYGTRLDVVEGQPGRDVQLSLVAQGRTFELRNHDVPELIRLLENYLHVSDDRPSNATVRISFLERPGLWDELRPGDIVCHRGSGAAYVIQHDNERCGYVAVRALELSNPAEWELVLLPRRSFEHEDGANR